MKMPLNNLVFVLFFMVVSLHLSDAGVCKYGCSLQALLIDCMIDVLMMYRVLTSSKRIQCNVLNLTDVTFCQYSYLEKNF